MNERSRWYGAPYEDRFVRSSNGCWEWIAGRYANGYGRWHHDYAHREAWRRAHGPIPDGLLICHHCDNRICVNPTHLFLGTIADNNYDMYRKKVIPTPGLASP